jgi:Zn-dependent protease with chaperone function
VKTTLKLCSHVHFKPGRLLQVAAVSALLVGHYGVLLWLLDITLRPPVFAAVLVSLVGGGMLSSRFAHRIAEVFVSRSDFYVEVRRGALHGLIEQQAGLAGLNAVPKCIIYEDESVNAFVAGACAVNARLFISSACLTNLDQRQLSAIIAHEMNHIRNGDMGALMFMQGMFACLALPVWLAWLLLRSWAPLSRAAALRVPLTVNYGLSALVTPFAKLALLLILRRWEYEADRQASRQVGRQRFVDTLRCLHTLQGPAPVLAASSSEGLSRGHGIQLSHPSLDQRIKAVLRH